MKITKYVSSARNHFKHYYNDGDVKYHGLFFTYCYDIIIIGYEYNNITKGFHLLK